METNFGTYSSIEKFDYAKPYKLWYRDEVPFENEDSPEYTMAPDDGWERWSLPIGNGYMGANIYGRKATERILVTENSMCNPYVRGKGGLNSFADLRIHFWHEGCENYIRYLDLNSAISGVEYIYNGIKYTRSYFTSYPDRVFVMKFEASKKNALSFEIETIIPYVKPYLYEPGDGMGKTGQVLSQSNDSIILSGEMEYYKIAYEGQLKVISDGGTTESKNGKITVKNASSAMVILAVGTNYCMDARVFTEPNPAKKLSHFPHPHNKVTEILKKASEKAYDLLLEEHLRDYKSLFNRVEFSISNEQCEIPTNLMLDEYKNGIQHPYLEELYFQYGRYLLISSSRPGTYPANLQGTWNKYDSSPWSSGYWHNINVQMNYWPAFNTNLAELFAPYIDYFNAYMPLAKSNADDYIKNVFPDRYDGNGNNGWAIGTGAWLYTISGAELPYHGHSGPGTGGLTAKLFWEYYAFTQDNNTLKSLVFPALEGMALFLSKTLEKHGDKYLVKYSASPEQKHNGEFHYTVGCAFDQQMVYETYYDLIQSADSMDKETKIVSTARQQVDHLDPVLIGKSGQVKEYREENNYGDIGEYHHRHISQLVGLYPGTCINSTKPETLNAAAVSLSERGNSTIGWSTAHRLNAWARIRNGNNAYLTYRNLLENCTFNNLWDAHPPFQIDGNFGGTAGVAEMLLQSHEGCIDIIQAIPDVWKTGYFKGLVARGNFVVNAWWKQGVITKLEILSRAGGGCRLRFPVQAKILDANANEIACEYRDGIIIFETSTNCLYSIIT